MYPNKFYHATINIYLDSIKKYGLGGKIPKIRFWDYNGTIYQNMKQGVFLTNDPYVAYDFIDSSDAYWDLAENNDNISIIVFEIDAKDIDMSKLSIDANMNNDESFTWFYNSVIPYNKLKLIEL